MKSIRRYGFSALELVIVIAIVIVLMAMLLPGILNPNKMNTVLAQKQVADIQAAAERYAEKFYQFPPDTGKFSTGDSPDTVIDSDAIYKYLGREWTDASGKKHEAFLTINPKNLKGPNGQTYVDPWGQPYQLDAVHTTTDPATREITRFGEPFPAGTNDTQKTPMIKIWSPGPDKKDATGSNQVTGKGTDPVDADNICSWAAQ